jgi:hypothetical protein
MTIRFSSSIAKWMLSERLSCLFDGARVVVSIQISMGYQALALRQQTMQRE